MTPARTLAVFTYPKIHTTTGISFIRVVGGKIASIDEYWGDDGPAPGWRQEKHIGTKIKE